MTSDGAEYRFWLYADSANENRYVSDTGGVFDMRLNAAGQVVVYTKRTATGYTTNAYTRSAPTPWAGPSTASCSTSRATPTRCPARRAATPGHSSRPPAPPPTPSPCSRPPTAPPRRTCSSARIRTPTCGSMTCALADGGFVDPPPVTDMPITAVELQQLPCRYGPRRRAELRRLPRALRRPPRYPL